MADIASRSPEPTAQGHTFALIDWRINNPIINWKDGLRAIYAILKYNLQRRQV
jgi:hypothetical protein